MRVRKGFNVYLDHYLMDFSCQRLNVKDIRKSSFDDLFSIGNGCSIGTISYLFFPFKPGKSLV